MKENSSSTNIISVCDVMKDNTSKILKKVESQIPSYVQLYSDLYTEYLHMLEDLYGTCYISEKKFFDKLNLDTNTLESFDFNLKKLTEIQSNQIEISTQIAKAVIQSGISSIKTIDIQIHLMLDLYSKMLDQYNSFYENH